MSYTSGEWEASDILGLSYDVWSSNIWKSRILIAECFKKDDAILIAAAPDLLEDLKNALPLLVAASFTLSFNEKGKQLLKKIEDDTKKAEGN